MIKVVLAGAVSLLILLSLVVIYLSELSPKDTFKDKVSSRTVTPPSVNIDLDSKFNNFKNHTSLTLDTLPCSLYEQKHKHVDPLGKLITGNYDSITSELLVSLMREITKVKNQKSLLQNLKIVKPERIVIDTSKLQQLHLNLMKTKNVIDNREEEIKLLKESFRPSVVSGKQWEIDVEQQFISYLKKRLEYLRSLKPKSLDVHTNDNINRIEKTLESSESTLYKIVDNIDQNHNVERFDEEISHLENLKVYWQLRLEEVKKCQTTDKGYRSDQNTETSRELERLKRAQKQHDNADYCMELRKHLVLKLIKEFDVIQSDFNCLKEKSRVEGELRKITGRLEVLNEKNKKSMGFNPHKYDQDLSNLKDNYNAINSALEYGIKRLEVGYDANVLKEIIQSTEDDLRTHEERHNELLKGDTNQEYSEDPDKIVKLANMNLKLKEEYCRDWQEYERENQLIRNRIDQVSAERSVQNVGVERYLTITKEIKKSMDEIALIKEKLIVKLERL